MRQRRFARIAVAGSLAAAGLLLTAQASSASWLQQDTPNVPGAGATWEFAAVSCTSPSVCMAVGSASVSTGQLLSETRSAAGWTIRHIPEPSPNSFLNDVWCTSAKACTAVGASPTGGGDLPLAERWNGSNWHIQPTPKPAGLTTAGLAGVACPSAHLCFAAGFASKNTREVPLVERWNGSRWTIQATPTPRGTASVLLGISCASASRCVAVGSSSKPGGFVTLAEVWNGSRWSIHATPSPRSGGEFNAVWCLSRDDCMAVGNGISARFNGRKWSLIKLGFPGGPADLTSISCTRANACYADGGFFLDGVQNAVAEFWNGDRWRVQDAPISTSFDSAVFSGISCTTATNCTAVGSYHDPVDGNRALAEDFSLRWQDQSPMPFSGVLAVGLSSVSCASLNACVTVGSFETSTTFETFSETWDGTAWTSQLPPKPKISNLDAVSCAAASFCIAVGDIESGSRLVTLAERWNGVGWAIQGTPSQPGATGNFLLGVSCPGKSDCTAVGRSNRVGSQAALAEQWNGKAWRLERTPKPAGQSLTSLSGVSCPSAGACEAVGAGTAGAFAESWNGKKWTVQATPLPTGGRDGSLSGVSCTAANACAAVGTYLRGSHEVPLVERWNGRRWSAQRAAVPGGAAASGLVSVSCASARACVAVGTATRTFTNAIAERWFGRTWALVPVDRPPVAVTTNLSSVSCSSTVACMATGNYLDTTPTQQMLAEQYS